MGITIKGYCDACGRYGELDSLRMIWCLRCSKDDSHRDSRYSAKMWHQLTMFAFASTVYTVILNQTMCLPFAIMMGIPLGMLQTAVVFAI